jgi:asparagine synthase (glutamine-hydrolysing)
MVRKDQLKWVLRQAFKDIMPDSITRRPKHGFNHPVDHWLKTSWSHLIEETFGPGSALSKKGIISKEALQRSKEMLFDKERLNGHTLFTLIILNRWLELNT